MSALQRLLDEGVREGVFPSAQAVVLHEGRIAFEGAAGEADLRTVYDLASLTKVVCTTPLFLALWGEGRLGPETPLSRFFPDSPASKAGVTLGDLLYHRSGLPAWEVYFARAMPAVPELFDPTCPAWVRADVRKEVVDAAAKTGLHQPVGASAVYSDVGFILLGEALAQVAGAPLDAVFEERVAKPLGLDARFRRLSALPRGDAQLAPTGKDRPREPAPGQEMRWAPFPAHASRPGEVDDDNAWVMDGVSGHAGLFGTAAGVARFGQAVLDDYQGAGKLAPLPLWRLALRVDARTPGSTRAMGFDTPSAEGSSAGAALGRKPPGAVGHTGFTGVSLWVDLARRLVVALCSNRTYLGRANVRIKDFRPRFHDAVVAELGL